MIKDEGDMQHIPVMLEEVVSLLSPSTGRLYADCTFGQGGYARAILEKADCKLIAMDRDPAAQGAAESLRQAHPQAFYFEQNCFAELDETLLNSPFQQEHDGFDGIVFDLGVSSVQLDNGERGFSFRLDGPLDMRMSSSGESVADLLEYIEQSELSRILFEYGEERRANRIAAAIIAARTQKKQNEAGETRIETTLELANIISAAVPMGAQYKKSGKQVHPATKSFQALRIAINQELKQLEIGLEKAFNLLKPDGRLIVVSFHSLEDRLVKHFLNVKMGKNQGASRHAPPVSHHIAQCHTLIKGNFLKPSAEEISKNSRSRSAKLRAVSILHTPKKWEPVFG